MLCPRPKGVQHICGDCQLPSCCFPAWHVLSMSCVLEIALCPASTLDLSLNLVFIVSFNFFSPLLPHPSSCFHPILNRDCFVVQSNLLGVTCHSPQLPSAGTEFSCFVRYLVLISSLPLHSSPGIAQQAAA